MAERPKTERRPSFWSFWTTLPGVITAVTSLIVAVTGLLTLLISAGILGADDNTSLESDNGGPGGTPPGLEATGTSPGVETTGTSSPGMEATGGTDLHETSWSASSNGGFLYFESASGLTSTAYEFEEYNDRRNVIGGGSVTLEGNTLYIHYAYNDFIGEYTGELTLSQDGTTLSGTIQPKFGEETAITMRRQ